MRSITRSTLLTAPSLVRRALAHLTRSPSPARLSRRVNGYFLLCFVATVAFVYLQFPSLSYRAELYYEMGTNFFAHAYHGSLWDNLWARDAGYLPWIPRAVSVFLVKGLGLVKWYPRGAQLAAALIIAFFSALINLRAFRSFIEHDASRFLVALSFGFFLIADQSIVPLFNASYFSVIFLFLVLTIRQSALSWPAVIALGLAAAVCLLSKGSFLVLVPIYGLMLLYCCARRDRKATAFYAVATAAALVQFYTVYRSQTGENLMYHARGLGYLKQTREFAKDLLFYVGNSFPLHLLKQTTPSGVVQGCFLVGGLLAAAAGELLRRGQWRWVAFVAACAAAAVGSFTLTILAMPPTATWITGNCVSVSPRTFVAAVALHLAAVALIVRLVPRRGPQVALLGLLFVALLALRPCHLGCDETPPADMVSQWKVYHKLLAFDDYAIPVNSDYYYISRNCGDLNWANRPRWLPGPALDLRQHWPWSDRWEVRAVMFEVAPAERPQMAGAHLIAVDGAGRQVAVTRSITPPENRYQYFLFPQRVQAAHLALTGADGAGLRVGLGDLRVYGVSK